MIITVFVIIFIAPIALYFLGVFNPSEYVGRLPVGFTTLGSPDDWMLESNGDFNLVISNRLPREIEITKVRVEENGVSDEWIPPSTTTIGPGGYFTTTSGINIGSQASGRTYTINIEIHYKDQGLDKIETGSLTGSVKY